MENRGFSISQVLKLGWEKFKEQPLVWIGALLLTLMIFASEVYAQNFAMGYPFSWDPTDTLSEVESFSPLVYLVWLAYTIIKAGLMLGLIYMGLRAVDGLKLHIYHLFGRFHYVFHYLIAYIAYTIMLMVGFLLLFFPGAIWASKFALYPYFIIDRGAGPFQAFKLSSEATKGFKWDVFAFFLISFLLFVAGTLALLVGLLVVMPIINIAWAAVYRKLQVSSELENKEISNAVQLPILENKVD